MTERRSSRDRRAAEPVERVLPHNLEAERAVLGALMINAEAFVSLPMGFTEEDFYRDAHRRIYAAMRRLWDRHVSVDLVTIGEELRRLGEYDAVGGPAYVASLTDGVPRAVNAQHYANIVMDHAARRGVIRLANQMLLAAYEAEASPADLVADAQQGIVELSEAAHRKGPASVAQILPETIRVIQDAHDRGDPVIGVATGYTELDALTAGLQAGELALLAARPSVGKTALALNIAESAARAMVVVVYSLEMTKEALNRRLLSSRARIDGHALRTGRLSAADFERMATAMSEMSELALVIDDTPTVPVEDLPRRVRRVTVEYGPVGLVVVDYLQLLGTRGRFENRTQQVSFISKSLKGLAMELKVPVLALSQLSRGVEERKDKKPVLSDLRESGSLEQDADLVMFLHRSEKHDSEAALIVAKQRNGPLATVDLYFHAGHTRFENKSYAEERD